MRVVSYGGGTNSTALLVGMVSRGQSADLILFADTGGEKPHTYEYMDIFNTWLTNHGMPQIVTVKAPNKTLEQDCIDRKVLPSVAFGFKTCSQRWKGQPQNKYLNNLEQAKEVWKSGGKVEKLIGFDADEPHRAKDFDDNKYNVTYPLIEWGWGREECMEAITDAGLLLPGKSACYFCPSSKKHEILQLARMYPDLAERAIAMEKNAELSQVKGLGRNYAWGDLLSAEEGQKQMFPESYIEIDCGCYDG